jgi:hypothetical protein
VLFSSILADQLLTLASKRIYGPFRNGKDSERKIMIIIEDDGTRRTVSYPKFLMEEHLGRRLDPDKETVDHIDFDINNNDISNLRLVPREEHSADDTRRVKLISIPCSWCGEKFERSPRVLRDKHRKGVIGTFCSKSCAGKSARAKQLGAGKKLSPPPFTPSTYFRRKSLAELVSRLLPKYS